MSTINELPSEERLNNVKENLVGVRELIVRADKIVDAEQYAMVGGSILTAAFAFVWYWDPSFVTFVAFLGFVATLTDYLGPKALPYLFNTNNWTEDNEKKYNAVCDHIVRIFNRMESGLTWYKEWRSEKPLVNCMATVVTLLTVAWIGNRINNFLLAYVLTMGLVVLPKLLRQGMLQNGMDMLKPQLEKAGAFVSAQFDNLTKKVFKLGDTMKEKYTMIKTE